MAVTGLGRQKGEFPQGLSPEKETFGRELTRAAGRLSSLRLAPRCGRMAATPFLPSRQPVQSGCFGGIQPAHGWERCKDLRVALQQTLAMHA
jgi:hypothetical protein